MSAPHVVIVGASLAGYRTYTSLRREGFTGPVTLIGDEPHVPYDRPPLSKQILLGKWDFDKLDLASHLDVDEEQGAFTMRLGVAATHLDVALKTVTLADGREVHGDVIVIATGTRARTLSFSAGSELHSVRTKDDAHELLAALRALSDDAQVALIGGGFIGAEVATALSGRGLHVTVFEGQAMPLAAVLGTTVASWLLPLPANVGVDLRVSQQVHDVRRVGTRFELTANNETFEADLVLVGVGAVTNTEWLASSGLTIDRGVVTNEYLEAAPDVYAVGDVSVFPYTMNGKTKATRIEHWQIAVDHAAYLAQRLATGSKEPFLTVPYFWSDQYGKKIQMLGHPDPSDDVEMVSGSVDDGKWLAQYRREGRITGVIALNNPRELMLSRELFTF